MIAVDTNVIVYAHRGESQWHAPARRALARLAGGRRPWGIPWSCVHEFVAVATHSRIFDPPSSIDEAIAEIDGWIRSPTVHLLSETAAHLDRLRDLAAGAKSHGPRIHDARIAAVCLENGVTELWSADRDFTRFPALRVRNPLVDPDL